MCEIKDTYSYICSSFMTKSTIRLGTRGSKLALWQANTVTSELKDLGFEVEQTIIKTKGDQIQHLSFDKIEGKGFFTSEIEHALSKNDIDFAVHSMKDLPTTQTDGLMLAALSDRANPRDTLLLKKDVLIDNSPLQLKDKAVIGTSSTRRKANLLHLFPTIEIKDIRGNVPTRIEKLREGQFDGIILAQAGLDRLQLDVSDLYSFSFDPSDFVPAPAQGVLAYQCRRDDKEMIDILRKIHHFDTSDCTNVERKVLQMMDGGCHLPLGVYCRKDSMGYYHTIACFSEDLQTPLRKVKLSQSTSHKLADKIYDQLTGK